MQVYLFQCQSSFILTVFSVWNTRDWFRPLEPNCNTNPGAYSFESYLDLNENCSEDEEAARNSMIFSQSRYELREFDRKAGLSAWVDNDDSGTYDPKRELVATPKKRRRPTTLPPSGKNNNGEARPRKLRARTTHDNESLLKSLCSENDNHFTSGFPQFEQFSGYLTRSCVKPPPVVTETSEIDSEDPSLLGCKQCASTDLTCPLISDPNCYPCTLCAEDDLDCELVSLAAIKRACDTCRRDRVKCSYLQSGIREKPCERCREKGFGCCAGLFKPPAKDPPFVPTPERPFLACTQCRRLKRWCSLEGKRKQPPCKRCLSESSACTFEKLEKAPRQEIAVTKGIVVIAEPEATPITHTKPNSKETMTVAEPKITPIITAKPNASGGRLTIKTRFAHPIILNYRPPGDGSRPCHWCKDPVYGIVGLGEQEVEVRVGSNGAGHTELQGGHTSAGHESSRICEYCTTLRMYILCCPGHQMREIKGLDRMEFDFDAAYQELLPQHGHSKTIWCSMCPSPAFYECCTPQGDNQMVKMAMGEQAEGNNAMESAVPVGCGLVLCEACASHLGSSCQGSLKRLLAVTETKEEDYPIGPRADASFLTADGEIVRRLGY